MAVIDKVAIGNMALDNLGARSTIESFNEDSAEARTIKLWYDHSRIQTLETYPWKFATKRAALALSSEAAPTNVWAYRYQYPSDCIKARHLEQPEWSTHTIVNQPPLTLLQPDAVAFDIEMDSTGTFKTILTNLDDAVLVYTFDQQNPIHFSRQFIVALSFMLSFNIAIKVTGRRDVKADMWGLFKQHLAEAASSNLNEGIGHPEREASYIRARW